MENFIEYVHIQNFKSIVDLRLENCRRINLFIGYPNVGKSNVLEALGLFSVSFLDRGESLNKLVRVEDAIELFHSSSGLNECVISTDSQKIELRLSPGLTVCHSDSKGDIYYYFTNDGVRLSNKANFDDLANFDDKSNIKRYTFNSHNQWKSDNRKQLLPPFGENIIDVLSHSQDVSDVLNFIKQEFEKGGLQLVLNKKDKSILVQKSMNKEVVLLLPYSSLADTLQRLIFYKAAIASNKNSVLLFEEPEAHAFPPYIQEFTHDIADAKTNQFFIVTHSPFIVNDFLKYEDLRKEVAIYLFDYQNDQTVVKRLTDEDVSEVYEYGVDLFFNIERYLRDVYV